MYCVECAMLTPRQATVAIRMIDGDALCEVHSNGQGDLIVAQNSGGHRPGVETCSHGCGKPRHRGRCKGSVSIAISKASEPVRSKTEEKKRSTMDKLIAETVDIDSVPMEDGNSKRLIGRAGELWMRFQELPEGKALAVECRDSGHMGMTNRDLRKKAEAAGLKVGSSRKGKTYYCWKESSSVKQDQKEGTA